MSTPQPTLPVNAPQGLYARTRGRYANQSWQRSAAFNAVLEKTARTAAPSQTASRPPVSSAIARVDQSARGEYDNDAQAKVWSGSTCSAAALTAVIRGQGSQARIADVMRAMPGAMTPELGLISRPGLVRAAGQFGLNARDDVQGYDALSKATSGGKPVLVDVRNGQFPEGHWMVATNATSAGVDLVDSSGYRITSMTRDQFTRAWSGKGIRFGT